MAECAKSNQFAPTTDGRNPPRGSVQCCCRNCAGFRRIRPERRRSLTRA